MLSTDAEIMRLKYKYRRLIMSGKLSLPYENAAKLIGPDCAYHLYSAHKAKKSDNSPNDNSHSPDTEQK
jgi:hypothetical protein